jgi:filamentous hemagglutinin family protein
MGQRTSVLVLLIVCSGLLPAQAQVLSDGSTNTLVNSLDNLHFTITGGTTVGTNLFHSFQNFSVPSGGSATFSTIRPEVQTILSRVVGGASSNIDGVLNVVGSSADLFLINPSGIQFGSNASLNLGGSFLATTADRVLFEDGNFFSAIDTSHLLTISAPSGFLFNQNPAQIINRSKFQEFGVQVGLRVGPGETLGLLGGDVMMLDGTLSAPGAPLNIIADGGVIDIGAVGDGSVVGLELKPGGFELDYSGVTQFRNINLSSAEINATGNSGGQIRLVGRNITIEEDSNVLSLNFGTALGQQVLLRATESVSLLNSSSITTFSFSSGGVGQIHVIHLW